ncbi:MAG: GDP-mannose 4,6-dehydratase [Candidatus Methylomirabilis sp.]|nr:GDP-mannose 4,6-dehydratase [Deltaproteobacteria bacterium]
MSAILVTGGAGFIGSHVVDGLLARGDAVVCLDNFNDYYDPALKRANLAGARGAARFTLVEGDIEDVGTVEAVFRDHPVDRVVHLAARAGVRPSIENPRAYFAANVMGTVNLLEACRGRGLRTFVFASSSSVYGECERAPFREDFKIDQPVSPYAASKKAGELVCYNYHHLFGIDVSCLRFFTVYGPRQRPEMAIHQFARRIEEEKPIKMFGAGDTSRDYTYVDDIVGGVLAALDRCSGYNIYNLGRSDPVSLADLVATVEAAVGRKARIERLPPQPGDVSRTFADISRARADLGYDPKVSLAEGVARFVAWMRAGR